MQRLSIVGRFVALPMRHNLIAAGIALSIVALSFVGSRKLPQEFTSSAVLSFDDSEVNGVTDDAKQRHGRSAETVAESILSDDLLKTVARQLNLPPGNSDLSRDDSAARVRSHLALSEGSLKRLRVIWRGTDSEQAITATNTVSELLTSWIPTDRVTQQSADVPSPSLRHPIPLGAQARSTARKASLPKRVRVLTERRQTPPHDLAELQSRIESTNRRLTQLMGEQHTQESVHPVDAEKASELTARQSLMTQLSAAKKNLETLRARYTDAYPDVQTAQDHIAELERDFASLPSPHASPAPNQLSSDAAAREESDLRLELARLQRRFQDETKIENDLQAQELARQRSLTTNAGNSPVKPLLGKSEDRHAPVKNSVILTASTMSTGQIAHSPFAIVERASIAKPSNDKQQLVVWLGFLAGVLCGLLYLSLAFRWSHAVSNVARLMQVLPSDVPYLGAIPGIGR